MVFVSAIEDERNFLLSPDLHRKRYLTEEEAYYASYIVIGFFTLVFPVVAAINLINVARQRSLVSKAKKTGKKAE